MRVIDALLRPEVMRGEAWVSLRLRGVLRAASDLLLPSQTLGVNQVRGTMCWGDRIVGSAGDAGSTAGGEILHGLGDEASLSLSQLLCECVLVEPGTTRPTCQRCGAPILTEQTFDRKIESSVDCCDGRCEFDASL